MIETKTLPCSIHSAVWDFSYKPTLYTSIFLQQNGELLSTEQSTNNWDRIGWNYMDPWLVDTCHQNKSKPSQTMLIKKFKGISSLCHKF